MDVAPYSYRSDPAVPAFADDAPLIVFDGLCVLCSSGVSWMMARDSHGRSRFAAIQDAVPQALYRHYGLDAAAFYTFLVLADGKPHIRWAGLLAAGKTLPAPWPWLAALGHLMPRFIGDRVYDYVQRRRLRWFGTRQTCLMPTTAQRARFLES